MRKNTDQTTIKRKLIRTTNLVKYELVGVSVDMSGFNDKSTNPGWYAYKKSGLSATYGDTTLNNFYSKLLLTKNFDWLKSEICKHDNIIEFCVANGFAGIITHPNNMKFSTAFIDATFVTPNQVYDLMNDMDCDYYMVIVSKK